MKKFFSVILIITMLLFSMACGEQGHTHNHNILKYDSTSHWYECSCGDSASTQVHYGGTATNTQKAKCEVCSQEYGSFNGHTCDYSIKKASPEFLAIPARCEYPAEYFYSCVCGNKNSNTFASGNPLNHSYGDFISNNNGTHSKVCANDKTHVITENCTGGTATENSSAICEVCNHAYGNPATHEHNFTEQRIENIYLKEGRSCQNKAVYYYSCPCGAKGTETFEYGDIDTHVFNHYISNGDATFEADGTKTAYCAYGCNTTDTITDVGSKLYYIREGDYVYFGSYPQTLKADNVTVSTTQNENGYYTGSDGCEYAKLLSTPQNLTSKFNNGSIIGKDNEYYFKVEPIKWRILKEETDGITIMSDIVLTKSSYDDDSNNYKDSQIRAWLNSAFLTSAFDSVEQSKIVATLIDNSGFSTSNVVGGNTNPNACENTEDKIYLLSTVDAGNKNYGLGYLDKLKMNTTDYSRAIGVFINTQTDNYGYAKWWTRSPYSTNKNFAYAINVQGSINNAEMVMTNNIGVVPVLKIK